MMIVENNKFEDSVKRTITESWTSGNTRVKMTTRHVDKAYKTSVSVCKIEGIWETHRLNKDFYKIVSVIPCRRYQNKDLASVHRIALDNNGDMVRQLLEENLEVCVVG